jgi:hypothetical protein
MKFISKNHFYSYKYRMLKDKRISVLMNTDIKRIEGMNKVESVVFTRDT